MHYEKITNPRRAFERIDLVMKISLRQLVTAFVVILWMFVVVLPYYLFHRPFDVANVVGVASTLGDVAVVALLLVLAAALGRFFLRSFTFETVLEALVIQTGVGYAIIAFVIYALGFVGLIQPIVFWILLVLSLALLFRTVRAVLQQVRLVELPRVTRGEYLLTIFICVTLGIALVFSLMPPTGWDGIQYHLVFPKLALQQGRFSPPPDNLSLSNPSLVELLFLAAMGLKSDSAAQVIHWSYLVLTLGAVLVFAGRYFTWRMGWLAAAILIAVPSVLLISTWAYNDAALMLYTLTALFWTLRAIETKRARDFILAGILAGCALGEKYTAGFVALALGAIVLFQNGWRVPTLHALRNALLLGLVALALGLPWYVRNYFFVGNPMYPFVFGGLYWDAWRTAWYSRFGTGLVNEPLQLLLVPYTMTVQGFQGGDFDATIGALLLALLPFNVLKRVAARNKFVLRAMWFLSAVLFAFWLLGVAQSKLLWQTRLLFPVFPLFALLAAEGWSRLTQIQIPNFSAQRFALLVIALAFGLNLASNVLATVRANPFQMLLGMETREEYLTRNLGAHFILARWLDANLPRDARIVSLWEPRAYYIERAIEPDAILDRLAHLHFLHRGDSDAIAAEWRREGFTHILLFRQGLSGMLQSGYDPIGAGEMETLRALEEKHLRPLYDDARLNLTVQDGKPALSDAERKPYAVYEIIK